jgi:segregation and condensation protein B
MEVTELKAAIEAIVFVAEEPVTFLKFKEVFPAESLDKLQTAIAELMEQFNRERPGLEIREIAGGIRMTTRPEHHEWIRAYLQTRPSAKLSLPALETLAVIAYRQPITLAEILAVRGVKSSSSIRTLLEKKFITPCGRKKVVGRPILYGTTKEFLVHFGLKDLSELPTLKEFEDLIGAELPERNMPAETAAFESLPPPVPLLENGAAEGGESEAPSSEPCVALEQGE